MIYRILLSATVVVVLVSTCLPAHGLSAYSESQVIEAIGRVENGPPCLRYDCNGMAAGRWQIHRRFYADAARHDRTINPGCWRNCATDNTLSRRVVRAWLDRYARAAVLQHRWEIVIRRFNGGPKGERNPKTLRYLAIVQAELEHGGE
jgi:hypothetical protein